MLRGRRTKLVVLAVFVATAVLAAGAWAYDSSRDDLIAEGVRVGGVDVGGLRADAARERLRARLQAKLERPVRVAVAGRRFRLTAERSGLVVDLDGMVDAAVGRSRSGGLPARLWRGLAGSSVEAELPAKADYSRAAVERFVRRVKRAVDRPARSAEVKLSTVSLPTIPSRTGLKLNATHLRRSVRSALVVPGAGRKVRLRARVTQPKVTTDELADKYPRFITIDRPGFRLRYFERLKLAKTYVVGVGASGFETPTGLYHVQNKAVNPTWHVPKKPWAGKLAGKVIPPGPDNPIKARWMGIYDGAGIHGTADVASLGTPASHGCIRMSIPQVEELYDRVPVQTPIYIQ
jgi:lipoprotein-anchoring transpeptidase ErfK/SrfK